MWVRYIDDVLCIWEGSKELLLEFHIWLNSRNPHIQFTMDSSNEKIPFLDISIYVDDNRLQTTLFRKPTERNSLLQYGSHHPRGFKDNLPVGQFLRIRRNCSTRGNYIQESEVLSERLISRSYPARMVRRARKRAWYNPRDILLNPEITNQSEMDRIICVTTFSTRSNEVKRIINKNWSLVSDEIQQTQFPLHSFKRAKNIRDMVVHSYLKPVSQPTLTSLWNLPPLVGHYRCGTCSACQTTIQTKTFDRKDLQVKTSHELQFELFDLHCPMPM